MHDRNIFGLSLFCTLTLAASLSLCASHAHALESATSSDSGYNKPPAFILDVLHAPSPPVPFLSPTGANILLVSWQNYPSIDHVATPFLRLAGVRVEPKNHSRHDTLGGHGITPCAMTYEVVKVAQGSSKRIALPAGACPSGPIWSADGKRFAFKISTNDAVELWIGDAGTGKVHRVEGVRLNPMLGSVAQWMPDQKSLIVKLVPDNIGEPPTVPAAPMGPSIQESTAATGRSSTYEKRDTLKNKHDEDLFNYYAASQLALVDATSNKVTHIAKAGIYDDVIPSPNGELILISSIHKPYSYLTTYDRFPKSIDIWSHSGKNLAHIASLPLADRVPVHGVPTGPRDFDWRPTEGATLTWVEALDGGDWNVNVAMRDKVMSQKPPFRDPPAEILRTEQRFNGFLWSEKAQLTFYREFDENRHWTRTFLANIDDKSQKAQILWDMSDDEAYKNPGEPVLKQLNNGFWVVRLDGNAIHLSGNGASLEGDRPFLDRFDLDTRKSERLYRSDRSSYERFLGFRSEDARSFLTWHQSQSSPPNAFLRTLGAAALENSRDEAKFASTSKAITQIPDPAPEVRAITKRLVKYKREDGLDLSFTLYLPPNYKEGTRLPAILNAYPLDYADASAAGQVSGSENKFTQLREYKLLLLAGYAIIDHAAFPIVGDPKKAYDTYMQQLLMNARAAVNKAVEIGVADPQRIGITGHSHGALMTANLLAHSNLFRAGVATSGSYNKTLTPFGFQNERRSIWEAQSVYLNVSPFFVAEKMKLPLLIMHGEDDANPGTTPLQAEKFYEAIRGNGGTTRLVMLPHEPHWYSAMESHEQLIYEMLRWFDRYVKNAP